MNAKRRLFACSLALLVGLSLVGSLAEAAAAIVIQNNDGAGEGFNDPTPAAPVGGNTGTTLGEQRLIAFQAAADIWGATLDSVPIIVVQANFDPLACSASSAVLGSAGPRIVFREFTGAPLAGHWYHNALANKISGVDLSIGGEAEIAARFNSNLGNAGCLTGTFFYLGLDNNHGANVDLVTVLLHEFGHGLGFSTTTSGSTGAQLVGFPSAYDNFVQDTTTGLLWNAMTDGERATSALNARRVVWDGANVTNQVSTVLTQGTPQLVVTAPSNVAGTYLVGTAAFGEPLLASPLVGELMPVVDQPTGKGLACNPLSPLNALAVNGKVALVDRGTCGFVVKVKNAQNAGALAVIVVDNVAGSPPPGLGGADNTISIPSVRITLADGNTLKSQLRFRSRAHSGVFVNLLTDDTVKAGADALGRALLYTPNPFQGGSSVSHWDTSASPNLLMEPAINGDLTHNVQSPFDLTFELLLDLGW